VIREWIGMSVNCLKMNGLGELKYQKRCLGLINRGSGLELYGCGLY